MIRQKYKNVQKNRKNSSKNDKKQWKIQKMGGLLFHLFSVIIWTKISRFIQIDILWKSANL